MATSLLKYLNPMNLFASNKELVIQTPATQTKTGSLSRLVTLNFCPGHFKTPYGRWWLPTGKTPAECIICDYCYNNKCMGTITITSYTNEEVDNGNCNCACPKSKEHPQPDNILCPICYFESSKVLVSFASCGYCQQCKNPTAYTAMNLCTICSQLFRACHKCTESIHIGDSYIPKIIAYLEREDVHKTAFLKREIIKLFEGKSADDIIEMSRQKYKTILDILN